MADIVTVQHVSMKAAPEKIPFEGLSDGGFTGPGQTGEASGEKEGEAEPVTALCDAGGVMEI